MKLLHLLPFLLLFLITCSDDTPDASTTPGAVIIINEGNFNNGNSTLSSYNPLTQETATLLFQSANNRPLGDVGFSAMMTNDKLYVVVNNSQKIERLNPLTLVSEGIIPTGEGSSPRTMVQVSSTMAYVTDLYSSYVFQINLESNSVTDSIQVGANPEGMVVTQSKAYVANGGFGNGNTVSVIDVVEHTVIKTISIGDNPSKVRLAADGTVWVLATGGYGSDFSDPSDDTPAGIFVIDPTTDSVIESIPLLNHPGELTMNQRDGKAYVNDEGIRMIDQSTFEISSSPVSTKSFYSLGFSELENRLYAGDALNFTSNGVVTVFSNMGDSLTSFSSGIIPGDFIFLQAPE